MTLSAKWTAVSCFGVAALGAAAFAFSGCSSTTTGTVYDDGGTTGTDQDSSTEDAADASVHACPGNTKQTVTFSSTSYPDCQTKLESVCCSELTTCFDIAAGTDPDSGTALLDCNKYSTCIDQCNTAGGDTNTCFDGCDSVATPGVVDAYNSLITCTKTNAPAPTCPTQ